MDKDEEKTLKDIEEYGCHVITVLDEGDYPRFTYSVGIQKTTEQPELVVTGLKKELAHWMVNEYCERVKNGEIFESDEMYSGFLEGFDVTFKSVNKEHYKDYFGWDLWLYKGDNFNVLQLVYPSTSGVWPWDKNAPEDYTWFIPKLYD